MSKPKKSEVRAAAQQALEDTGHPSIAIISVASSMGVSPKKAAKAVAHAVEQKDKGER